MEIADLQPRVRRVAVRVISRARSPSRAAPCAGSSCRAPAKSSRKELDDLVGRRERSSARADSSWARIGRRGAHQLGAEGGRRRACSSGVRRGRRRATATAALHGRARRRTSPTCSGRLRLQVAKRAGLLKPTTSGSSGSPSSRCSSGTRTRSAGTRCTIRSRRRGRRTCRCSRSAPGSRPRARLRPRAQRLGDRRRQHPNSSRRRAAARVPAARHLGRGREGALRLLPRRARVRHAAARRHRLRPRSHRRADVRRSVDSRGHRVPEDRAGRGPDGRRAVGGGRSDSCASCKIKIARQSVGPIALHASRHRSRRHQDRGRRARTTTGACVWESASPTPRDDYDGTIDAIAALVGDGESGGRRAVHGRHRHARRDLAGDRARQERQLHLAQRPAAAGGSRAAARPRRCGWPTTRTASPSPRRPTAPRPARAVVFGVILGTGTGGGIVVDGRVVDGRQRDRRRVGPQPAAVAGRRRAAGPGVLLRPARLHRDVSVRARPSRPTTARAAGADVARRRRGRARPAPATPARGRARRVAARLARALATVINVSIPT